MNKTHSAFLELLRAVVQEIKPEDPGFSCAEWEDFFQFAERHKLLPLALDAACALPSCRAALSERPERREDADAPYAGSASRSWRELAMEQIALQVMQENEFLNLMLALRERGLSPLVLKGPVCRLLYPKPLLRPSVDDDLLIPDAQAAACHAALLELGLTADRPDEDPERAYELSYHKPGTPLYIELHKRLFDPDSEVFAAFNGYFEGAAERAEPFGLQDLSLLTLAPTDHLLFLLLHAFKHFLYSGFGLRIVADVCLYTWRYGERIDFSRVLEVCDRLRCERFAAALYGIGEKYLDLPAPEPFACLGVDENALLGDVLDAGLVGAEIDRLHSANITLGAVADSNKGTARGGGLRRTLFPGAKQLAGRYPYLVRRPWLLPAAWVSRTAAYLRDRGQYGEQSPAASLRIGKERVRLLEYYGVIDAE